MSNGTTAIQKREVVELLNQSEKAISERLPAGIDPRKFLLTVATLCQKNPDLANCDPKSVLLAVYEAAELGVNMSPALQLGYLIPYGSKAQFQLGYRGMIQKAYETGDVKTIFAEVVYEHDKFQRQFAPKRNVFHAPADGERGDKIGAYALIEFKDGSLDWEYMTTEQVERRRKHSKQSNGMLWTTFWEEGWRKTPIRALFKRIPLTSRALEAFAEAVSREALEDEEEPAGRLELAADSPIAQANPPAQPQSTPQEAPIAKNGQSTPAEPRMHDIAVLIGAKDTVFRGDVRRIVEDLPKIGAKLNKASKTWTMPAGRTHELLSLCDKKTVTWVEVDSNGNVVPQPEEEQHETLFNS